jgi:hypothetical protein
LLINNFHGRTIATSEQPSAIMGYFHKIKQSKDFAKQKKEEAKTKNMEPEPPKERYVHRPRHARTDAINSTPLHYTQADRQQISEGGRRRSQMLFLSRSNSGYSTPTTLTRPGSYSEGLVWADRGDVNARPTGLRRSHSGFAYSGSGPSRRESEILSVWTMLTMPRAITNLFIKGAHATTSNLSQRHSRVVDWCYLDRSSFQR